jgi:asparagine synthase (glutamine-hydrolysing)
MCGIAGCWDGRARAAALAEVGEAMAATLHHRGPDGRGIFVDEAAGLVLAHTRLAILDLSADGAQPMRSADGRFVLSYNGELYDHAELRRDLEARGHRFRGRSDTEVLVEAVAAFGLERTLARANGMFAFALYDRAERRLFLARDRLGEKPLYYGWFGGVLLFASELKALRVHPAFDGAIDRGALALYLRHGYVPQPHAIYRAVRKLPPGSFLAVGGGAAPGEPRAYWSAAAVAAEGLARPFEGTDAEAVDALDALLGDAVRLRMAADVPLGAFLSGGIDSSTVVALMQARSAAPVETFSIGFDDPAVDEAPHARAVAEHLGTRHHELYVSGADALAVVPRLPALYDEPFSDPSQIPTFLLSRFTRTRVTVSLSGDAGDELFAGYGRYAEAARLWRLLRPIPGPVRSALGALASPSGAGALAARALALAPAALRRRARTAAELAPCRDFPALWRALVSHWREPVVLGAVEPETAFSRAARAGAGWPGGALEQGVLLDWLTYLPDDILVKVDRASMAVGLEARVPLLDPRVVALAWSFPRALKQRGGTTKWVLRQVLHRYVPAALVERPKRGFTAPIGRWLRGELRAWAGDLLSPARLRREGLLDAARVEAKVREHARGERDWGWALFGVLVFEAWLEAQRGRPRAEARRAPARAV